MRRRAWIPPGIDDRPASPHTLRELEWAFLFGPLEEGDPVPGCNCWGCGGAFPAPVRTDLSAVTCPRCARYRELVRDSAAIFYACSTCRTRSATAWPLSAVGDMLTELPVVPDAPRHQQRERAPLDIDRARSVPIRELAEQLGLQVNRAGLCRCIWHQDRHPSMQIGGRRNIAYCHVCARAADPIALLQAVRGVDFVTAVRELAA